MSHLKYTALSPELYQYILDVSQPLSSVLTTMEMGNQTHPQIQMQIGHDQAQFLQFLIKSKLVHRILELGTFLGFSTAAMAEALPDDGKIITCDQDAKTIELAKAQWEKAGLNHKIESMMGPALISMQNLIAQGQHFDFIFIDADKRNYIEYYQYAKKLLQPKGLIAVDNTLFHAEVLHPENSKAAHAIHEFNLYVQKDPEVDACLLSIADGLTLIQFK
jgi:predicted O-methyltransferase YrrM